MEYENAISMITQLHILLNEISPEKLLQNDPEIFILASARASSPSTEGRQSTDITP